jgi:hypothetical protein
MPIIFEEIAAEVAPERGAERAETAARPAPAEGFDPAELVRRELQRMHERAQRLLAD